MIVRPENMNFKDQNFAMILYGQPGIGKSTLAASAPNPVLIDFDNGVSRIRAEHRPATSISSTYEEVLADIQNMKEFDTIIIDTGGSFVTYLKDWAFRTQQGCKTKTGAPNTLKIFGAVKNEFARLTEEIKNLMHKNVIYVFHSVESENADGSPYQRLLCEGSAKNTVWTPCDFGAYMTMLGNKRTLYFTPQDEFFAKGTHGIIGKWEVPDLVPGGKNDFLTQLFDKARENIEHENDIYKEQKEQYVRIMAQAKVVVDSVKDADTANKAIAELKSYAHALTSQKEASVMLNEKAASLGLKFSREAGGYIPKETT